MRKPRTARTLVISAALLAITAVLLPIAQAEAGHGQQRAGAGDAGAAAEQAAGRLVQPGRDLRHATASHAASRGSTAGAASGPSASTTAGRHVLFGGTLNLLPEQGKVGHLGIIRRYYSIGQKFEGPRIASIMQQGSTFLLSLDSPRKGGPSYASIAAGKHDAAILSFLTQVDRDAVHYRTPAVYIGFQHEANNPANKILGTTAQFVAAWKHIHSLAARARLNWNTGGRLHWVLILMHMAYFTVSERPRWSLSMGFAANYFAGNSYVDAVAADGYNAGSCGLKEPPGFLQPGSSYVSPASMFNPALAFAQAHGHMPVFIAEWGSVRYRNSAVRPEFIHAMQQYVLANPAIKGVSYWDSWGLGLRGQGSPSACNISVNNDPQSLAALAVMNHALQG